MERTVLAHDAESGIATVKFVFNGVELVGDYDLRKVIPGSVKVMEDMGITFSEDLQLKALDKLTETIQKQIEEGIIVAPVSPEPPAYEAPAEPVESDVVAVVEDETGEVEAPVAEVKVTPPATKYSSSKRKR